MGNGNANKCTCDDVRYVMQIKIITIVFRALDVNGKFPLKMRRGVN